MLRGRLSTYSPLRRLVAFICEPTSTISDGLRLEVSSSDVGNAILFIPGLTDGFLATSYVQPLAEAAGEA